MSGYFRFRLDTASEALRVWAMPRFTGEAQQYGDVPEARARAENYIRTTRFETGGVPLKLDSALRLAESLFTDQRQDPQTDEIAAPQLAVDGKVADRMGILEVNADGPDVLGLKGWLLADELSFVPGFAFLMVSTFDSLVIDRSHIFRPYRQANRSRQTV